jgi:hypothetical protein|tara:strand:+ start:482 stop:652 length:171 start_codon:yes stop_codon:yes gene_type:complete
MKITVKELIKVADAIKSDISWVNDSHTKAEHRGICEGLNCLVGHFKLMEKLRKGQK